MAIRSQARAVLFGLTRLLVHLTMVESINFSNHRNFKSPWNSKGFFEENLFKSNYYIDAITDNLRKVVNNLVRIRLSEDLCRFLVPKISQKIGW